MSRIFASDSFPFNFMNRFDPGILSALGLAFNGDPRINKRVFGL